MKLKYEISASLISVTTTMINYQNINNIANLRKMKTKKIPIPENSLICSYLPANYSDSFECNCVSSKEITPDDMLIALWTTWPIWLKWLFKLRSILVKPFKLKSDIDDYVENLKQCLINAKPNKYISVSSKSDEETVMCTIDKHLTFYLSVIVRKEKEDKKTIITTTLVNFHNILGRCYFTVIYPFHTIIVPTMVKHFLKKMK